MMTCGESMAHIIIDRGSSSDPEAILYASIASCIHQVQHGMARMVDIIRKPHSMPLLTSSQASTTILIAPTVTH